MESVFRNTGYGKSIITEYGVEKFVDVYINKLN